MCRQLLKMMTIVALFSSAAALAQPALTRSTLAPVYTPLSISTGATASTATGDNAFQDLIPIGFTFNFLGTNYTTIGVSTNGIAAFSGITGSAANTDLYTTNAPNTVLAPWWDDLEVVNGTGSVLYQLQGTPGSQQFIIQWTDVHSYSAGSTALLNFQVVLFEGSNNIDFRYGAAPSGTFSTQESASIGIKSAAGGNGEYIDAVTGSSFTGNAMLSASVTWPAKRFRFTPGAPAPIAGGNRTVGLTGYYSSLSEAVADVNHHGLSDILTLTLTDSLYDNTPAHGSNFFPILIGPVEGALTTSSLNIISSTAVIRAIVRSPGRESGVCVSQGSSAVITASTEPIVGLIGAQFVSLTNIILESTTAKVDRGVSALNSSATLGTQYCGVQGVHIRLDRTNTNTIGLDQRIVTTPSPGGTNSFNVYMNLLVSDCYAGILLEGDASLPDTSCTIGSTAPGTFTRVGANVADDIGNGSLPTYGIRAANQVGVAIFNNEVRNVSVSGAVSCDGIILEGGRGICRIHSNKVHTISNHSLAATAEVTGIRASLHPALGQELLIYNNFVRTINSAYAGPVSATRQLRGIYVQYAGGGSASSLVSVDFNNVLIDATATAISNTCFEIGTVTGPMIRVRNNIFSNATGAQVSPAAHFCWTSAAAASTGNAGSISNYNDLHVANTTRGFTGNGGASLYASLAAWQSATGMDAASLSIDPMFTSATDLHINAPALNGAGQTNLDILVDIEGDIRGTPPDIGADEWTILDDIGIVSLTAPGAGACYSANQQLTVRIRNYGTSILDFTADTVWITVNVSGASAQTINYALSDNALNGGNPLPPNSILDVPVGTISMTAAGTYYFDAYTTLAGDPVSSNDTMAQASVAYSAGTAVSSSTNICEGSSITLSVSGNTASTLQWQQSTDGGNTWVNSTGAGSTSAMFTTTPMGPTMYRSRMCSALNSNAVSIAWNAIPPVTISASATSICAGDTTTLTASSTQNYSYTWLPPASLSATAGATVMAWPAVTTSYVVIGDSANCSTRDTIEITVNAGPVVSVINTDPTICFGSSDTIYVSASGTYAYSWTSNPPGFTSSNDTIIVSPAMTTDFLLSATDITSGCTTEYIASVTVDSLPVASFSHSSSNGVVIFTNTSTNADAYLWDFGDSQTSTAVNPTHTYNISGAYTVVLTASNSCGVDTASDLIMLIVGVAALDNNNNITVYPNPATDYVTIALEDEENDEVLVELYDELGQLVDGQQLQRTPNSFTFIMNLDTYEQGAYYLRVCSGHSARIVRIVVLD